MMKRQTGFTLVETLVALVITGLVSYLVFNTLQMASSSSQRLANHVSNYHALKRTKEWFRLSVEGILAQKNFQPHFEGGLQSFTAYSNYTILSELPSFTRVTWSIQGNQDVAILSFTEGETGESVEVFSWPQSADSLKFQYIDRNMEVHDQWSRNEALFAVPEAIVISSEQSDVFSIVRIWGEKSLPIDLGRM